MLQLWWRDWLAMRTFSRTVAPGRMLVIWYERAIALREMACGGNPAMSSPLNTIRPLVGRITPVSELKNVDLPAPFGPMIPRISPRGTERLTLLTAARPPNRTVRASVVRSGVESVRADTLWRMTRNVPIRWNAPGPRCLYANLQAGGTSVFSLAMVSSSLCLLFWIVKMNSRRNAW